MMRVVPRVDRCLPANRRRSRLCARDSSSTYVSIRRSFSCAIVAVVAGFFSAPAVAQGLDSLTLSGQYGPVVQLSAGAPTGTGGLTVALSNSTTGGTTTGSPTDVETFTFNVDYGDLSRGDGNPVVGEVGLRVRSNTSFKLVASVSSFNATPLIYEGRELGGGDKGSFVRFWLGPVNATGANANAGNVNVNGAASNGMRLSDVAHGPITSNSTVLCTGTAASQAGAIGGQGNAIDVPVFISVPTGYELGPAPGGGRASFSFSLQFAAFPGH